ncbi:MAG: hypothetical protein KYX65_12610 [Tabrizicola sp.]|nr:hypothetical protein [Tabrizicola sp.]
MQKSADADWVGYVLRDVITFLAANEMMQSAQMLAVAASYIEHEMKRQTKTKAQSVSAEGAKIVAFPTSRRVAH